MHFDLQLFTELNREYAQRRTHSARSNKPQAVVERGQRRARWLHRQFGLRGKRCLEVGCGRGEVVRAIAERYGCEATGVDIETYDEWSMPQTKGATLLQRDISSEHTADLGRFDLIFSFSVWEHMRRPYEALIAAKKLLHPRGDFYLSANLYRGSQASHRYRDVFFPWPHLLFSDEVFEAFYVSRKKPPKRAAWVNRLCADEYLAYFERIGLSVVDCSYSTTKFDEQFYRRFEDILGRYPRADLERDFINVHLRHKARWRRLGQRLLNLEPTVVTKRVGQAARLVQANLVR